MSMDSQFGTEAPASTGTPGHSHSTSGQTERHDGGHGDAHPTLTHDRTKPFFCPRCAVSYPKSKEFKRHFRESCEPTKSFVCPEPGCGSKFNRLTRFKDHHRNIHNCSQHNPHAPCTHHGNALRPLPTRRAFGCGFCQDYFQDHAAFLLHQVKHCEAGDSRQGCTVTNRVHGLLKRPDVQETWLSVWLQSGEVSPLDWDAVDVTAFVAMLEGDLPPQEELEAQLLRLLALGRPEPTQQQYVPWHPRLSTSFDMDADVDDTIPKQAQSLRWEDPAVEFLNLDPLLRTGYEPTGTGFPDGYPAEPASADHDYFSCRYAGGCDECSIHQTMGANTMPSNALGTSDLDACPLQQPAMGLDQYTFDYPLDPLTYNHYAFAAPGDPARAVGEYAAQHTDVPHMPWLPSAESILEPATENGNFTQPCIQLPIAQGHLPPEENSSDLLRSTDVHDPPFAHNMDPERASKRRRVLPSNLQQTLDPLARPSSSRSPNGHPSK